MQRRLEQKMTQAFADVVEVYRENEGRIDLRTAAHVVAVGRVAAAMRMRGLPL